LCYTRLTGTLATILIIEDDDNTRILVKVMLKRGGYSVQAVTNAAEALQSLEGSTPDLIILDLALPGMNGIELCGYIREHPSTRETPILILTASIDAISIRKSQEAGANAFVKKPIFPTDMLANVHNLLDE